jgi:SAM-dependent methyltransferase
VGLDPTEPLLARAKERDPGGTYVKGSGEQLPFENDSFDVVAFYLTLIDIPDYRKAIQEAARVLRPGGRMVIGNLAPHATTSPSGWVRDANGKKLYFPIDNYCEEWGIEVAWAGIKVINYHRPLSDYMSAFLGAGLLLREYLEPVPGKEFVAMNPDMEYERRVPYLVAMLWEKPL